MGLSDPRREPKAGDPAGSRAEPIPPHPSPDGSAPPPDPPPAAPSGAGLALSGFGEVLRIRNFRLLFWGQAVSALGDWVSTLAVIAAASQLAPGRPEAVAGVLVLRLLPTFFATPLGGVLSDRWDRKRIMIGSDLLRSGIVVLIPFFPNLAVLYVLTFAREALSLVFLPARDASLPNIVRRDQLEAGNALIMGSSFGGIPLSGPVFALLAVAGAHVPEWIPGAEVFRARPWAFAFLFDAFTFVFSVAFLARLTLPKRAHGEGDEQERFFSAAQEGTRYILQRPLLRGLAIAVTLGMLGGGVLFALGIGYVRQTLGGGDVEFGWLMGLFGAGMLGGFVVAQLKPPGGVLWVVRISLLVMSGVLIVMALIPVLWIGYLMAVGFGMSFSVALIVAMSTVQGTTADEYRGRVMGAVHMLVRAALVLGALASAGIATLVPEDGIRFPLIGYRLDRNQFALLVAGGLMIAGLLGVRGRDDARDDA